MTPENKCASIGCPAACCGNIEIPMSKDEFTRFSNNHQVIYVNPRLYDTNIPIEEIASLPDGIIAIAPSDSLDGQLHVIVKGACPHLNQTTYDCDAFGKPERPGVCSEVRIGHPTCTSKRRIVGLSRLRFDGTPVQEASEDGTNAPQIV